MLTETFQIKKLTFVDGVFQEDASSSKDDRFDADAAIATGEIRKLIPDLLEALGGELVMGATPLAAAVVVGDADSAPF